MTEINYLEESNTTAIKKRFAAAKERIKALRCWKMKDFAAYVVNEMPEFDSVDGFKIISDAWNKNKPNLAMMELLENHLKELES